MKFTYNGVEYRIGFQHTTTTKQRGGRTIYKQATTAYIRTGVRDKDEQIVAEGTFTHYGKTKSFAKETLRQLALQNMIEKLYQCASPLARADFYSAINTAYHTRPGGLGAKREVTLAQVARVLGCNATYETVTQSLAARFAPKVATA